MPPRILGRSGSDTLPPVGDPDSASTHRHHLIHSRNVSRNVAGHSQYIWSDTVDTSYEMALPEVSVGTELAPPDDLAEAATARRAAARARRMALGNSTGFNTVIGQSPYSFHRWRMRMLWTWDSARLDPGEVSPSQAGALAVVLSDPVLWWAALIGVARGPSAGMTVLVRAHAKGLAYRWGVVRDVMVGVDPAECEPADLTGAMQVLSTVIAHTTGRARVEAVAALAVCHCWAGHPEAAITLAYTRCPPQHHTLWPLAEVLDKIRLDDPWASQPAGDPAA